MALDAMLEALMTAMSAAMPHRIVSRRLMPFEQRDRTELEAGIWTIVTLGEGRYPNYMGREAQLGTLDLILIGQFKLADDAAGDVVERAEMAMAEELKAFCAGVMPAGVEQLLLLSWSGTGQLEAPYGGVRCELELST